MKVNKRYLGLRISTCLIKLAFTLLWNILLSFMITFQWVINGSQELQYGNEGKDSLTKLIEQNEKIIKHLETKTS